MPATIQNPLFSHRLITLHGLPIHQIQLNGNTTLQPQELFRRLHIQLPESIKHSRRKRQLEFLAGRLAAQHALQLNNTATAFHLSRGSHGQPEFPQPWQGSLSHSSRQQQSIAVACVQSHHQRPQYIGIDIEQQQHQYLLAEHHAMLAVFLQPEEQKHLPTHNIARAKLALLIFSAKESIIKALFYKYQRLIRFTAILYQHITGQSLYFRVVQPENHINLQQVKVHFTYTEHELITLALI